ncbi:unnamed protein product [Onchocerca flexuosa]|uniref:Uncharacterized protein n=1 Tax=Onchocerca flexuosa TaxID=387005 RepID=A0A183HXA8_9BILA|nr:unnamed protein product [Onchocerca flexuosa]
MPISRSTTPKISRKPSNLEQLLFPSLTASTNTDNCSTPESQTAVTAHALITVNQPLNLPMSSDANSHILMPTSFQYKTVQTNNQSQVNEQGRVLLYLLI